MCGIFAYVGEAQAAPLLVEGLRRLEYRGYDSAGLATLDQGQVHVRKRVGPVQELARCLDQQPAPGFLGIAHTRWATHGRASVQNAHPHTSSDGSVVLVHNGVVENHAALRRRLQAEGISFQSDTDTEVIAQLIARAWRGDFLAAVRQALAQIEGSYALAILSPRQPGLLVGARRHSPLVIGHGRAGRFLASDPNALHGFATEVTYLDDDQLCTITAQAERLCRRDGSTATAQVQPLREGPSPLVTGAFPHHMLEEIHAQPAVLAATLEGRLTDPVTFAEMDDALLAGIDRLILTGCGTSYHAALLGEYLIEELARLPVEVEYASEFRYRDPPLDRRTLVAVISQSGETADTLAALQAAQNLGRPTLALCNVATSSIARMADACISLRAGPELGVASTKAFMAQVAILILLALYLAERHGRSRRMVRSLVRALADMPELVRQTLGCADQIGRLAQCYARARQFLYLGRQYLFPIALEGALKLKEISYLPAQGYPAAEMKHGPLAVVDRHTPSVFLLSPGPLFHKVMSNLEEIKARGGPVIAIASAGAAEVSSRADDVVFLPAVPACLQPLLAVVPLQLLAYHFAVLRGHDVDKPRHLAKSVTVE